MADLLWWHWIALGILLVLAELVLASFFIIWFGLGALCVGAILTISPNFGWQTQVLIWVLLTAVFAAAWFTYARQRDNIDTGQANSAIGEVGLIVSKVSETQRGKIRFQKPVMGAEEWPCIANTELTVGSRAELIGVEGQILKVRSK